MQKTLDTASSDNFFHVSVLDPLYFSWLNNAQCRHSCICAAFIFLNVLIAGCSGSLFFTCPKTPPFSLLDNRRYKALLFAVTAKPSETKLKTGQGKFRQSRADKPRSWGLANSLRSLWLVPSSRQYWAAGLQELKSYLKQYAIERTLLFILFSVITE